jgi:hypothetical protein
VKVETLPFISKRSLLLLAGVLYILSPVRLAAQVSEANVIALQNPYTYNCVTPEYPFLQIQQRSYGFIKPAVSDLDPLHPEAYFPIMLLFVQFAGDIGTDVPWWHAGSPPEYMNEFLSPVKKYPVVGNWWDTYSESSENMSDYWMEQSHGRFNVIGKAYSVILDHDYVYYQTHGGMLMINADIYQKLSKIGIDWREFDKWKVVQGPTGFIFTFEPDGYVDMIYKVHRSHAPKVYMPAGGMAALGEAGVQGEENYLIDTANGIKINGGYYFHGSGVTLTPGYGGNENDNTYFPYAPMTKWGTASFSQHEHGHYTFGPGHSCYGKMSGSGAPYGYDECLSPWEAVYLQYVIPSAVDYSKAEYTLGDFSSRNSNDTGEVLEVPLAPPDYNEVFLIANRTKLSAYDRIMWGDTARGDPYRAINFEYGKGVYIYHTPTGYNLYPSFVDQECADGLYSWNFSGYKHPDWSNVQDVEYYTRLNVSYKNDQSLGSKECADGKSIYNYFGIGKLHDCIGCDGTDRIFSTKTDAWTSREFQGDRWDAWRVGYNELFSPYSSPSTKTWTESNSGVFIWYYADDPETKKAKFKIFKVGSNGETEESILAQTPPSRPMGLQAIFSECIDGYKYPKIFWLHNNEPDMLNYSVPPFDKKFYNVFIAKSSNINIVPDEYVYLTTVDIKYDSIPYFVDYNHPVSCTGGDTTVEVLRYAVTAIDGMGWQSVKSDFVQIIAVSAAGDNNNVNYLVPNNFGLSQNYPNPFNPVTQISYSIPYNGYVKLTVYNVLGEETGILVNEYREAGSYKTEFNGSSLPSGVYFYVLETSGYMSVKKMVLLK